MSEDLLGYGQWRQIATIELDGERGTLVPLLPLEGLGPAVARVIAVRDVPATGVRGGHAHQRARQGIVALAGSFDVAVASTPDRSGAEVIALVPSAGPVVAGPGVWIWLENFSPDAVALTLFDLAHDPGELISN